MVRVQGQMYSCVLQGHMGRLQDSHSHQNVHSVQVRGVINSVKIECSNLINDVGINVISLHFISKSTKVVN